MHKRRLPKAKTSKGSRSNAVSAFLTLLETIHGNFQELSSLRARIETVRGDLSNAESRRDLLENDLLHARDDSRIDSAGLSLIQDHLSSWEADIFKLGPQLSALQMEAEDLEKIWDASWEDLRSRSEHYFNECLAVDLEAPWSLSEKSCLWLRHCSDQQDVISRCHKRITGFWVEFGLMKIRVSETPYQTEKDYFKEEAGQIESKISFEKKQLARRKKQYSEDRNDFCKDVIRPLLEAAGRIEPEPNQHSAGSVEPSMKSNGNMQVDETANLEDDIGGEDEAHMQDEAADGVMPGDEPSGSRSPSSSLEELQQSFVEQQHIVHRLRRVHDIGIDQLRVCECDHLLTFTDSSHETYEQFIAKQTAGCEEERGIEEEKLARRRLSADDVRPDVDKASAEHSPGKSLASSEGLRSRSRSRSRSPDPEWDEYLEKHRDQYQKQQKKGLGNYAMPTVESESEPES